MGLKGRFASFAKNRMRSLNWRFYVFLQIQDVHSSSDSLIDQNDRGISF